MSSARPRALRVAIDMDGVLADLNAALSREATALFEEPLVPGGPPLSAARSRRLWNRVRSIENFWMTLDEIEPGSVARLAAVCEERRWETIFLTTRPETAGERAQTQTHRWLVDHGFPRPSVFVVRRSRGVIAAALELDAVVDDRAENCVDVVSDSSARAVLTWRGTGEMPDIAASRLRIDIVTGFAEGLDLLGQIDAQREPSRSRLADILHSFTTRPAQAV